MTFKGVKLILLSFIIFATTTLCCGCNDYNINDEIVGNWLPSSAVLNGDTVAYSTLELKDNYFAFEFSKKGGCHAKIAGIDYNGTYKFSGSSIDVVFSDTTEKLIYDRVQKTITYSYDSQTSFSFSKENT